MDKKNARDYSKIFEVFKEKYDDIISFGKTLGSGSFGEVRVVKIGKENYAAKLIEKKNRNKIELEKLRGKNIIEIYKVYEEKINDKYYDLIIMEKALLNNVKIFIENIFNMVLLKTINNPFDEIIGNNLLRFFTKQIVNGLEILDRNELVHFDIKPQNILITSRLKLKISDFSFLRNLIEFQDKIEIPGGTKGFVSPEYYKKIIDDKNLAKKHDYFSLGATIFFLKFKKSPLLYKEYSSADTSMTHVINLLQKSISFIKSDLSLDKDFISFLCSLLAYLPQDRPDFEEIYRNKWLNENLNEINEISSSYYKNEDKKLLMELFKSDFLIEKKKQNKDIKKCRFKFVK